MTIGNEPATTSRVRSSGGLLRAALKGAAEAVVVFVILFVFLAGWRRDFRVPVYFSYDALEYLMQVKGTIENGWWWVHPRLSAPGVFEQVQYPSNTTVDQALVWIVHFVTREPALTINVSWMIMVVLSALIASRCLVLLGLPRRAALPAGLLFALSPYALSRHIDHFSLAIYLVPLPCTVALLVATNRLGQLRRPQKWALLAGCLLVGLNYTYYAFFACFLILVASLIAFGTDWNRLALRRGLTFVGAISVATAINLAPSLYAWAEHGRPVSIPQKRAAESEQYGLKIRQLISPVLDHSFPPFRHWTDLETNARYPLETENQSARLGAIGTLGFLILLCGLFVPRVSAAFSDGPLFINAGRLTLAALLLATVGGFGSLFNLLVSPEIRAYNRVTAFIAFFCAVATALVIERLLASRLANSKARPWILGALVAALFLGLYDHSRVVDSLNRDYDGIRQEWEELGRFVGSLEGRLPAGAMVFQLPVMTYLNELGRAKMLPNDHIKPYVASSRVHWSYPALSDSVVRWQQQVSRLPTPVLATALADQGFAAVLIDRNGYMDRGQSLLTELGAFSSPNAVLAESDRYVALDLRFVRKGDVPTDRLPHLGTKATAATTGAPKCGTSPTYNVEWVGGSSQPFARPPVKVPLSGEFFVVGWAVDERNHSVAADVDIVVGDKTVSAFYGIDRPDVAKYFGVPAYLASGFTARLQGAEVGNGVRSLSIRILAADRSCYYSGPTISIVAQ